MKTIIKNAQIVNEGTIIQGDLLIENERIVKFGGVIDSLKAIEIDAKGNFLLPGCIDDQVHFREPGLTHKANISSESKAAVAGGITTFFEMPNTVPPTTTQELLQQKYDIAEKSSYANYSFFMGGANDNFEEVMKTNPKNVCGLKIFMGSSTGNMLVDNEIALEKFFTNSNLLIATHCEDEQTIKNNLAIFKEKYGENIPFNQHHHIRTAEACYISSSKAINLAKKHNTRLHILHISTAKEIDLFENKLPLAQKRITAEACVHHLWFSEEDYETKGPWIKWNPAIKTTFDRSAIWEGLLNDKIDIVATDHAPHTIDEKNLPYLQAPSGGPLVQHALVALLEKVNQGVISIEKLVEKMSHSPAICFQIKERGFIREGYFADLVIVEKNNWKVEKENILYACGWSPFEGQIFQNKISHTFVNGNLMYDNGNFNEINKGKRVEFER